MSIENRPKQIEQKHIDNRDQIFYGNKTFADSLGVDSIQFDTSPSAIPNEEGLLRWNAADGTLDLGMSGGDITLQVGQEMFMKVRNVSGSTIPNGSPVYISGRTGNRPNIYLAKSDLDSTASVVGLTTQSIDSPADGFVTTMGYVRQIKTNYSGSGAWGTTWAEGDKLYVSKSIAGQLTNIEPTAPHHSDCVGTVGIVGNTGIGSILVSIQTHTTMEELADIDGTPLTTTGQFPSWHNDTKVFDFDQNIKNYLLKEGVQLSKQLSGFLFGDAIDVSYSHANRTITLTGDLRYLWLGEVKQLTSPWTSTPHAAMTGQWFLSSSDGTNFTWAMNSPWLFEYIQVSVVRYGALAIDSFAIRETHGIMDFESHEIVHTQIGTYRVSGGQVTAGTYLENTATDAAVTPGFDVAVIKDEDVSSTIPAWTQGTYTTLYIGVGGVATFSTTASRPFTAGAGEFLYVNNTSTGAFVPGINNRFYNVYQVLIPATSDSDSQKYRTVMLQPQFEYTSQSAAQSEDVRILSFGNISLSSPEFVLYTRITYSTSSGYANTGKCVIPTNGITYVIGNRAGQVSISGFTTNNHQTLSNLSWGSSGHIGTANTLASFDASGLPVELPISGSSGVSESLAIAYSIAL